MEVTNQQKDSANLISLKNLGAATVNILNAIGIRTRDDLAAVGSAQAFRLIRQRGINASLAMLYALEAALLDVHWKSLEATLKAQLVKKVEQMDEEDKVAA